jgi:DNA-binding MurR/RpiR family transcriptional regulator
LKDESPDFGTKHEQALAALLSSPTIRAAKKAGVSETTLWRYMHEPEFSKKYSEARRDVVEHMAVRLQSRANDAAAILFTIAKDKKAPASARVTAAKAIIEQTLKTIELLDLDVRLKEIERRLEARKGGKR